MFYHTGAWSLVKGAWYRLGATWRPVVKAWVNDNGVWQQIHPQQRRFDIASAIAGITTWNLDTNGPLYISGPGTWTITPKPGFSCFVRIWAGGGGGGASGKPDFGGSSGLNGGNSAFAGSLGANGGGGGTRGRDGGGGGAGGVASAPGGPGVEAFYGSNGGGGHPQTHGGEGGASPLGGGVTSQAGSVRTGDDGNFPGGGAGGGGTDSDTVTGGGGGGGGGCAQHTFAVGDLVSAFTVTIGGGGAAGTKASGFSGGAAGGNGSAGALYIQ